MGNGSIKKNVFIMKKYILIILFIFNSSLLFSENENILLNYFNYSFSKNIDNGNINHAVGTDLIMLHDNFINNYGLKYVFGDNIVNIQYSFMPTFYQILIENKCDYYYLFPVLGFGMNISYNINKNIFGISPQLNINLLTLIFIKFDLSYRYNINFNYNNSHEIEFRVGIINIFMFIKALANITV